MDETQNYPQSMSRPLVALMKGVVFREKDERLWQSLENNHIPMREYVKVMGLDLVLDTAEGYAYLTNRDPEEGEETLPRLVGRRKLSYPVSLIIALLRKKLAENDASGEDTRLILSVEEISDMVKVFFPGGSDEARLIDRIDSHLNKIEELGFIRRLRGARDKIEVVRILKAFVDAQWLSNFEERLKEYRDKRIELNGNDDQPDSGKDE